jgi:serine protease Do
VDVTRATVALVFVAFGSVLLAPGASGCDRGRHEQPREAAAPSPPSPPPSPLPGPQITASGEATIADVAAHALPSVVNIFATTVVRGPSQGPFSEDPFFRFFQGQGGGKAERRSRSLGSGVIVRADGTILTNNHVVQRADSIRVVLSDGRDLEAKVVGTDPASDLAVIRLKDAPEGLEPIELADSRRLRLGDVVLAIGNPFGVGQTVTMGIVSAKGRANMGIVDYEDFIQTDAAINPGNSGGALVDMEGKLVGINTAILSRTGGYEGIGFAIPSNMVKPIMDALLENGRVVRGYLGVMIQEIDEPMKRALGLATEEGVLVADVASGSPAARAGIEPRDVIVSFDGRPIESTGQLRNQVAMKGANVTVQLGVVRGDSRRTVSVELGEMPTEPPGPAEPAPAEPLMGGLTLAPLDPTIRARFDLPSSVQGLVVVEVAPGGGADLAGIEPGDILVEANGTPLDSVQSFQHVFDRARDQVLLWVQRDGLRTYVVLPKG